MEGRERFRTQGKYRLLNVELPLLHKSLNTHEKKTIIYNVNLLKNTVYVHDSSKCNDLGARN